MYLKTTVDKCRLHDKVHFRRFIAPLQSELKV